MAPHRHGSLWPAWRRRSCLTSQNVSSLTRVSQRLAVAVACGSCKRNLMWMPQPYARNFGRLRRNIACTCLLRSGGFPHAIRTPGKCMFDPEAQPLMGSGVRVCGMKPLQCVTGSPTAPDDYIRACLLCRRPQMPGDHGAEPARPGAPPSTTTASSSTSPWPSCCTWRRRTPRPRSCLAPPASALRCALPCTLSCQHAVTCRSMHAGNNVPCFCQQLTRC